VQKRLGASVPAHEQTPELPKADFELHEGHAFGHDGKRDEIRAQEGTQILDEFVIDLIDAEGEAVDGVFGD